MEENRKTLKVYHGIIMLILSAVCVFFVSPILGANLGLYGTLLNEILLLVLAVALTAVVRGDFKQVFPIHKPKLSAVFGTILLWIGSFLAIMIITMIIAYFFPEEVIGVSQGLGMEFASLTFIISFVIVSLYIYLPQSYYACDPECAPHDCSRDIFSSCSSARGKDCIYNCQL